MSAFYRVSLIIIIGIIGTGNLGSMAQPQVVPKYLPVHVGTVSRFNCTAVQNDPVYWTTKPYGSTATHDIYIGEQYLVDDYGRSGRFSVEVNSTERRYDLVISAIMQTDAGVYICIDGRGFGKKTYAELVVYGRPICQEDSPKEYYMGENVFDLSPDVMRFSCHMNYSGNLRPRFEWSADGKTFEGTRGSDSEMESSSLELVPQGMFNHAVLTWKAVFRQGLHEVDRTEILWTSDPFRIHYTKWTNKAVKECEGIVWNLDCNPPCSYELENFGNGPNGTQCCMANYSTGNGFYEIPSCISAVSYSDTTGVSISAITLGILGAVVALCVGVLGSYLCRKIKNFSNAGSSSKHKNGHPGSIEKGSLVRNETTETDNDKTTVEVEMESLLSRDETGSVINSPAATETISESQIPAANDTNSHTRIFEANDTNSKTKNPAANDSISKTDIPADNDSISKTDIPAANDTNSKTKTPAANDSISKTDFLAAIDTNSKTKNPAANDSNSKTNIRAAKDSNL